jgi:hypothetical protein
MIIIHGIYKILKRKIAYKNVRCNHCNEIEHSEQFRAWYFLHLYFIPLLPLGSYKYWECGKCKNDPHARTQESKWMLWVGIVVFSVMLFATIFAGNIPKEDKSVMHIGQIVLALLVIYCGYKLKIRGNNKNTAILNPIYTDENCHYCKDKMVKINNGMMCEKCNLMRLDT